MKRISGLIMIIMPIILFSGINYRAGLEAADCRTITDMDDKKIQVPVCPRRIACMHGVSSDRIIFLGGGRQACTVHETLSMGCQDVSRDS